MKLAEALCYHGGTVTMKFGRRLRRELAVDVHGYFTVTEHRPFASSGRRSKVIYNERSEDEAVNAILNGDTK